MLSSTSRSELAQVIRDIPTGGQDTAAQASLGQIQQKVGNYSLPAGDLNALSIEKTRLESLTLEQRAQEEAEREAHEREMVARNDELSSLPRRPHAHDPHWIPR